MAAAGDYQGPPELTYDRALTDWHADPALLAVLAVLTAAYVLAVVRNRGRGNSWPVRRSVAFAAAIASAVLFTESFIGRYADVLFWVRAVQLTALFMIVPLFVALVRPLTLIAGLLSGDGAQRARQALRSRPVRALAHPSAGALLFMGLPWVVFFTPWLSAMLRYPAVDVVSDGFLVGVGFLYYWSRLQLDPVPTIYSPVVSLFLAFAEVMMNAVLGLLLIYAMGAGIAHDYFADLARPWGPSLSVDEQTGGGAYWVLGHAVGVPYLGLVLFQARRSDRRTAAAVDAAIEAQFPAGESPDEMRPWWETDPAVAHLGLNKPSTTTPGSNGGDGDH